MRRHAELQFELARKVKRTQSRGRRQILKVDTIRQCFLDIFGYCLSEARPQGSPMGLLDLNIGVVSDYVNGELRS